MPTAFASHPTTLIRLSVKISDSQQKDLSKRDEWRRLDGFGRALAGLASYPEKARVNTVRAVEDGNYVVCQTDYNFFGPKAGFDIFRFEDGKIVEHWDVMETIAPQSEWKHQNGKFNF